MIRSKRYLKYIAILIGAILILFFGYYFDQRYTYTSKTKEDATPVSITDWKKYDSKYGFSFMYPTNSKLEINNTTIKVENIILKIEILNCKNPMPTYKITSNTKLYDFPAQINEIEKFAYICNNTNTTCLDIEKQKNFIETNNTKVTEGFFHSFISSLNINSDFNKIECNK